MSSDGQPLSERECREEALASIRDAIAALQDVPAPAVDGHQIEQLQDADGNLRALERALVNEVDQLEEGHDAE